MLLHISGNSTNRALRYNVAASGCDVDSVSETGTKTRAGQGHQRDVRMRTVPEMTPLVYSAAGARCVLRKRRKAYHSAPSIRFSRFPIIIGIVLFALGFCTGRTLYGASVKETNGKETNGRETKRVLILYSFDKEEDFFYWFDRTLRSSLASKL